MTVLDRSGGLSIFKLNFKINVKSIHIFHVHTTCNLVTGCNQLTAHQPLPWETASQYFKHTLIGRVSNNTSLNEWNFINGVKTLISCLLTSSEDRDSVLQQTVIWSTWNIWLFNSSWINTFYLVSEIHFLLWLYLVFVFDCQSTKASSTFQEHQGQKSKPTFKVWFNVSHLLRSSVKLARLQRRSSETNSITGLKRRNEM